MRAARRESYNGRTPAHRFFDQWCMRVMSGCLRLHLRLLTSVPICVGGMARNQVGGCAEPAVVAGDERSSRGSADHVSEGGGGARRSQGRRLGLRSDARASAALEA